MAVQSDSLQIRPLSPAVGAEVLGADLGSESDTQAVQQAFVEHGIVVVRNQNLEPDDQIALARRFGEINVNRFFKAMDTHPEVALVIKEPDQKKNIGAKWHTDHSYDEIPALGSLLYAVETPPVGGDTLFASMSAAYDALSDGFKKTLEGLNAWHSSRHVFGESRAQTETGKDGRIGNRDAATQDAMHPVVITHPLSGRRGIYVNPTFTLSIDGWTEAESKALLDFLFEHCTQPEFVCRVRWSPGDLTIWDNRATWHKAINDYHGHRRHMRRITVEGCALA